MENDNVEIEDEPAPPVPLLGRRSIHEADIPVLPESERPYKRRRLTE